MGRIPRGVSRGYRSAAAGYPNIGVTGRIVVRRRLSDLIAIRVRSEAQVQSLILAFYGAGCAAASGLFDLDNTLVDRRGTLVDWAAELTTQHGLSHDDRANA
ncbi:hypothetical protein ACIPQH_17860 [Streptomyces rubiginosohelvolus]|uniref:hypothetical protein n=1 Tax=Streptomyces rubiginosohelvolus TaxID=67362 RepID=UPI0037F214DB